MKKRKKGQSHKLFWFCKRGFDLIGALLLLLLFSPVMIVTAIVIKFTSKGPIFADIPCRVGKDGKTFRLYKFRSMIVNAHDLIRTDPKYKKLFEEYKNGSFKSPENDPRITKIGKFIRKYSIDETPQFINVILGTMSIVGPRPYYEDELEIQQKKFPNTTGFVQEALTVKPGITGFWQVSGRSDIDFDRRIEMDAYYARKKSLILDILILLKTPWAMLSGDTH